jgi:hypothetical protein
MPTATLICQQCGESFTICRPVERINRTRFCSIACNAKSQANIPPLLDALKARLEERREHSENGCILYSMSLSKAGYGKMEYKRKTYLAHRVSYLIYKGPIPKGMHVCHSCDNRQCVNPDHLWLGTQKQNIQDMLTKGRDNYRFSCKLSDSQVAEIRAALKLKESQTSIAKRFGVSPSYVSMIGSGRSRKVSRDHQASFK